MPSRFSIVLLSTAFAVSSSVGCATTPDVGGRTLANSPREPVEHLANPSEAERISEWSGGGELPVGSATVKLPASPALLVRFRPAGVDRMADDVAGRALRAAGWNDAIEVLPFEIERTAAIRLLPTLLVGGLYGDKRFLSTLEKVRETAAPLLSKRLEHLDPAGTAVLAVGFSRQSRAIRGVRLGARTRRSGYPRWHAVRLVLPATDPAALEREFRAACESLRNPLKDRARERFGDGEATERRVERYVRRGTRSICGAIHRTSAADGRLRVDMYVDFGWGWADSRPRPARVDVRRTGPLRSTPALRTFGRSDLDVGLYTTSATLRQLSHVVGVGPRPRTLVSEALEFSDAAAVVARGPEGGLDADVVQSYTERGRRVAEAGETDRAVATVDVSDPVVSAARHWDLRAAGRAAGRPRWATPSAFQSPDDLEGAEIWDQFRGDEDLFRLLRIFLTLPTAAQQRNWKWSAFYERDTPPNTHFALQPSVARLSYGLSPGDDGPDRTDVVGAGAMVLRADFWDYLFPGSVRFYRRWLQPPDLEVRFRELAGGRLREYRFWAGGPREQLLGAPEPPSGPSLSIRADLGRLAETIPDGRTAQMEATIEKWRKRAETFERRARESEGRARREYARGAALLRQRIERLREYSGRDRRGIRQTLEVLGSVRMASRIEPGARVTHLRIGEGTPRSLAADSTDRDVRRPDPPPFCYTDLARLTAETLALERAAQFRPRATDRQRRGIVRRIRRRFDRIAEGCEDLEGTERADLSRTARTLHRRIGLFFHRRFENHAAAGAFELACTYGDDDACGAGPIYSNLDLPVVPHVSAGAPRAPTDVVENEALVMGREGLAERGRRLFTWRQFRETPARPEAGTAEAALPIARERQREEDRRVEPTTVERIYRDTEIVGGERWSAEREVLPVAADARVPTRYLTKAATQLDDTWSRYPETDYGGPPREACDPDEAYPRRRCREGGWKRRGYQHPPVALMVRRAGAGGNALRRGWILVRGTTAERPDATIRVTSAGLDVSVDGTSLSSDSRCADGDPTICVEGVGERALGAHETAFRKYAAGEPSTEAREELRRRYTRLVEEFDGERLTAAVRRARRAASGSTLQIVADGRIPAGVTVELASRALVETTSGAGSAAVTGPGFESIYLRTH